MGTMIDAGCRSSRRYRSRRGRSGKLFFCCFFSSSSMNISSRSILSPARHHRDQYPISLSASLSRRLRSDGSLKGGQSPMFPTTTTTSKKRTAGALDNPEPSSPKVTCIGQVRVKSKKKNNNKHARKLRNPSRRRSAGDGSFRRTENWGSVDLSSTAQSNNVPENRHRNQRWVHLPLVICEGLKGLGAEISCLSSSCFSSSSEKRERSIRSNLEEIEREKLEANNNKLDSSEEEDDDDEGRVCVPPKNALLLMRCKSDPMRMAALSRRLLESPPLPNGEDNNRNNVDKDADFEDSQPEWCSQANANLITPVIGGDEHLEADSIIDMPEEEDKSGMDEESEEESEQKREEPLEEKEEDSQRGSTMEEEEDFKRGSIMEEEDFKRGSIMEEEAEDIKRSSTMEEEEEEIKRGSIMEEEEEIKRGSIMEEEEEEIKRGSIMEEEEEEIKRGSIMEEEEEEEIKRGSTMEEEEEEIKKGSTMEEEKEMNVGCLSASGKEDEQELIGDENKEEEGDSVSVHSDSESEVKCEDLSMEEIVEVEEKATNDQSEEESEIHICGLWEEDDPSPPVLPDCLLLMMGEPKVSMEVSKETWVCTTDFMRFLPERRRPANNSHVDVDHEPEKKVDTTTNARPKAAELKQAQPRRSSCSIIPGGKAAPVLTAQKLPRCKSEPMRTAAGKLVPPSETCTLWKKSRKVEPLRRSGTVVVGVSSAAAVGF